MKRRTSQRTGSWTKRSERAIPYSLLARCSDWWCATRDAKKGLPALPNGSARAAVAEEPRTPRMMLLSQLGLGRIEKEWLVFQADVAEIREARRDAETRRTALEKELEVAQKRLDSMQEPAVVKVSGEDRTDPAIVAQRRAKDHAQRRAKEEQAVHGLTSQRDAAEQEVTKADEQVQIRLDVARRRAAMIQAHMLRRRAAYFTRLVRKHPEGARLNEVLRTQWPDQEEWDRAGNGPYRVSGPGEHEAGS